MKRNYCLAILALLAPFFAAAQGTPTEILLVGCDHLQQVYRKDQPATDVFNAKNQQDILAVVNALKAYRPDLILVERLPAEQPRLDSLYALFRANKLKLSELEDGRDEVYQLAFVLGKQLGLSAIDGVNAPGGTSQGILTNGRNIELYQQEGAALRQLVKDKYTQIQAGQLSLKDYITFLNQPETIQKTHHLRYITPARITHGRFTNPDKLVDTAFVNPDYIGAELTAVFKNRDYKIYSNIVTRQLARQSRKVLVLIGQAHIGSLRSIFRDDPAYKLIDATIYLK